MWKALLLLLDALGTAADPTYDPTCLRPNPGGGYTIRFECRESYGYTSHTWQFGEAGESGAAGTGAGGGGGASGGGGGAGGSGGAGGGGTGGGGTGGGGGNGGGAGPGCK